MQFLFVYLMGMTVTFFIFLVIDKDAVNEDNTLSSDLFVISAIWPISVLYLVSRLFSFCMKQLRWLNIHYRLANRKNNTTTHSSTEEKE